MQGLATYASGYRGPILRTCRERSRYVAKGYYQVHRTCFPDWFEFQGRGICDPYIRTSYIRLFIMVFPVLGKGVQKTKRGIRQDIDKTRSALLSGASICSKNVLPNRCHYANKLQTITYTQTWMLSPLLLDSTSYAVEDCDIHRILSCAI